MPETLFGYTIEEGDGTLVITVQGALAEAGLRALRERLADGTTPIMALLSPLVPIGRLMSARVELRSDSGDRVEFDETALTQQMDQTFIDFKEQLEEFRTAVEGLGSSGS